MQKLDFLQQHNAALLSLATHIVLLAIGGFATSNLSKRKLPEAVRIKIQTVPKDISPEDKIPKEVPPKPEKKPPPPKSKPQERAPKTSPQESAKQVQGLTQESLSTSATGMVAPLGNSLMIEDQGKRLRPEEVAALKKDLSRDARLILNTLVKPEYTQAALDAGIEGSFIVDVYVDASGAVQQADLAKKIGYGMDERVIASIKNSRFEPKRDERGVAIAGWAETRITLQID